MDKRKCGECNGKLPIFRDGSTFERAQLGHIIGPEHVFEMLGVVNDVENKTANTSVSGV
jgi:hypothetical protein